LATKKYQIELSDEIARHFGASKREVEEQIYEDAILQLLSLGKIDVFKAAELLDCDPDDLLTPEQEAIVAKGAEQVARGEVVSLDEMKKKYDL